MLRPLADTAPAKPKAPSEQAVPGGGEQQKAPTGQTNPGRTTQPRLGSGIHQDLEAQFPNSASSR